MSSPSLSSRLGMADRISTARTTSLRRAAFARRCVSNASAEPISAPAGAVDGREGGADMVDGGVRRILAILRDPWLIRHGKQMSCFAEIPRFDLCFLKVAFMSSLTPQNGY